jgi:galactan 5-O-arabinofuranosyltransferase
MLTESDADRTRRARIATAVVGLTALAAMGWLLLETTPPASTGDPTVDVAARLWLVLCTIAGVALVASPLPARAKGIMVAAVAGGALLVGAALVLSANDFAPIGAVLDQSTRTALITKYANHWGWVDFAYAKLPVYYPPLSFWIFGRLAALFSIAPWKMLKVETLTVAFVIPVLTWPMWSRIAGRAAATAAVVAGVLAFQAGGAQAWYRPHAWLGVALFVPWWLWAVMGIGRSRPTSRGQIVVAAAVGAAIFCIYYFPFFLGVIQLVLVYALARPAAKHGIDTRPRDPRRAAWVVGGAAVLSSPYWLPMLISIARHGAQIAFNRWYTPEFVDLRFRFLTFDLIGIVMLFGLVYLLATSVKSPVSLALLGLLVAAFLYAAVDYLGILSNFPLLSFQANDVTDTVLSVAAGLGAWQVWQFATKDPALLARFGSFAVRATLATVAVILVFALAQLGMDNMPYVKEQREAQYPSALLADFDRATQGKANNQVVFTDVSEIPVFENVFVFNWWDAHYMDPPALFNDRTDFMEALSRETNPTAFALAFAHNRYDTIHDVVFRPPSGDAPFQYTYTADAFPKGAVSKTITYEPNLFTNRLFVRVDTPNLTVFRIDRGHDPLRSLESCPRDPQASQCRVLATVERHYASHVDGTLSALIAKWRAALAKRT